MCNPDQFSFLSASLPSNLVQIQIEDRNEMGTKLDVKPLKISEGLVSQLLSVFGRKGMPKEVLGLFWLYLSGQP